MSNDNTHTLYIAGPMRGYAHHNFHSFFIAEELIRGTGVDVVNPARSFISDGVLKRNMEESPSLSEVTKLAEDVGFSEETAREFIKYDLLAIIDQCDGIVMLPGWERSAGAKVEWELAKFLGISISYMYPEMIEERKRQLKDGKAE